MTRRSLSRFTSSASCARALSWLEGRLASMRRLISSFRDSWSPTPTPVSRRRTRKLLASIERAGNRVAAMDLLIATAAILDDAQLVTRNAKDFERVPGLRVLRY